MRRRLVRSLPALAHWFHVRPWEVGLLTEAELVAMVEWIEANQAGAADAS